jgi:exodeoxyribonuclease VIII
MGTAIHTAILEPECFEERAVACPKFEGKGARANLAAWQNANKGKLVLKPEEMAVIDGILGSVRNHRTASELLKQGNAEESFFWQDPLTGIVCKCRPDLWKDGVIVDVKSSLNASPEEFPKSIANMQYHLQAALYLDGVSAVLGEAFTDFVILAVEKEPPYAVATYRLDEATIDAGRMLYRKALRILRQCKMRGYYPGYADRLLAASLPAWAWPTDAFDRDGFFPSQAG